MFKVVLKPKAKKQYDDLPKGVRLKVLSALEGLQADPWQGKKLQGKLDGLFSLRVWPYRIIYTVQKKIVTVTVVAIGQRKGIYRIA